MHITLNTPFNQVIVPQQSVTITGLTIQRMIDLPNEKVVRVFINELPNPIILWSGSTYDSIGQWTDADVQTRLTQIFS